MKKILLIIYIFFSNFSFSQCLQLTTNPQWVNIGDLDVTGNQLTVEALVFYTGGVNVVSKHTGPPDVNYLLRLSSFELTTTNGFYFMTNPFVMSTNTWYHIAGTYDGANIRYYVNGCLVITNPATGNLVNQNLATAIGNISAVQTEQYFGMIDEVRIWNVARTQAQIQANMNNLPTPTIQPGLLGYYQFTNNLLNAQGNATFNGVAVGAAPVYAAEPPTIITPAITALSTQNALCVNNTGTLGITATGSNIQYSINNSSYVNTSSFSGLATGNYTAYIRTAEGCLRQQPFTITLTPASSLTISPSSSVCSGNSKTLTVSGGNSFTWTPNINLNTPNGSTVIATPSIATNYTVNGNDANGCLTSTTTSVFINPLPNIYALSGNVLCDTNQLTWMQFNSITPSTATGSSGNYSVTVTQSNGGMFATAGVFNVGAFPPQYSLTPLNNVIANTTNGVFTFCFNQPIINPQVAFSSIGNAGLPVTINTSAPYQIIWNGTNMIYPSNTQLIGQEGFTIIKFPGSHTCISFDYLTAENYCNIMFGLQDLDCQKINVCPAQTANIVGYGSNTYTWSTGSNSRTLTINPTTTTQYTVSGTSAAGCVNSSTISVNVYSYTPISVNLSTICIGQQTSTLIANSSNTNYTWTPTATLNNSNTATVIASPTITTQYTVSGTDANNCVNTQTTQVVVNPLPVLVASNHSICIGSSTTMSVSGASTYTWVPSVTLNSFNSNTVTANPTVTAQYTVAGSNANNCINFTTSTITVNALPTLVATNNTLCPLNSASLTVSGAVTYTWNPSPTLSVLSNSVASVNPLITSQYTVSGTDANNCTNSVVATASVLPLPTLTITPNFSICSGSTGTLTVSGATTYTWNASANLSATTLSVTSAFPTTTETFTVIGSLNSCTNTAVITVSVIATPTLAVVTSSAIICPQGTSSLTASGAVNYTWSPSNTLNINTGSVVIASPIAGTNYSVIGAVSTCTNSAQITVSVAASPIILVPNISICSLTTGTITASGVSNYTWSPALYLNSTSSASVISNPPVTTTFTVSGVSALGCVGSNTVSVEVIATPTINVSSNILSICTGSSAILNATGASNYTWAPSATLSNINNSSTTATPTINTSYVVIGSNGISPSAICTDFKTIAINVLPKITPIVSPSTEICFGKSTTIYAIGGNTYNWIPSINVVKPNDSVTIVKPIITTIYTVTVSRNNLCAITETVMIIVNPIPTVDAGKDSTINIDESIDLIGTSTDATSFGFLAPTSEPLICNFCPIVNVAPKETTCYVLEGTNSFGCRNQDEVCITVTKLWDVFIPNAFTPNADFDNEYFMPKGYGVENFNMTIFDRWGTVIFKEKNSTIGWDGKMRGKIVEQGVYIYQIEITPMGGETIIKTGHVTLLGKLK